MTEYLGFWITSSKPSEADNPRWQQATKIDCSLFTSFFCLHQYLRFSRFQPKFCGVLPGCCPSPEKETRISNLWRLSHQNNTSLHKFTAKTPSRQSWNKFYLFPDQPEIRWHVTCCHHFACGQVALEKQSPRRIGWQKVFRRHSEDLSKPKQLRAPSTFSRCFQPNWKVLANWANYKLIFPIRKKV